MKVYNYEVDQTSYSKIFYEESQLTDITFADARLSVVLEVYGTMTYGYGDFNIPADLLFS
jgi:hypothetical protein